MNLQHMLRDLSNLEKEWDRNRKSPDSVGPSESAALIYIGVRMATAIVREHILSPHKLRGQSHKPYKDCREQR